jgi:hypothetical protein
MVASATTLNAAAARHGYPLLSSNASRALQASAATNARPAVSTAMALARSRETPGLRSIVGVLLLTVR